MLLLSAQSHDGCCCMHTVRFLCRGLECRGPDNHAQQARSPLIVCSLGEWKWNCSGITGRRSVPSPCTRPVPKGTSMAPVVFDSPTSAAWQTLCQPLRLATRVFVITLQLWCLHSSGSATFRYLSEWALMGTYTDADTHGMHVRVSL